MSLEGQHPVQLNELYRQVIMDHYARPRNKQPIADPTAAVHLMNPTCGDEITVQLRVEEGKVTGASFQGRGCSISQASASMMTVMLTGKTVAEAETAIRKFLGMMKGEPGPHKELGELQALQGVARYPVRIKCATLAWHAAEQGLQQATV